MTAKCVVEGRYLKIYFGDVLHLLLKTDEFVGLQSWVTGYKKQSYYIEFTTKTTTILTGYDKKAKWEKVLKLLDENEIWNLLE